MKTKLLTTLTGISLLLGACTSISTKTEFDKATDFSQLKTYRWGQSTTDIEKTGKTLDRIIEDVGNIANDNIPPVVNEELKTKGYTLIEEGKPDFIVQYALKSTVEEQQRRETYVPGTSHVTSIDQAGAMVIGKMTIYVLEPDSFKLLWRGEADAIIKADGKTRTRINRTVKKLMDDFPARQ